MSGRVILHRIPANTGRTLPRPVTGKRNGAADDPCREQYQEDHSSIFAACESVGRAGTVKGVRVKPRILRDDMYGYLR